MRKLIIAVPFQRNPSWRYPSLEREMDVVASISGGTAAFLRASPPSGEPSPAPSLQLRVSSSSSFLSTISRARRATKRKKEKRKNRYFPQPVVDQDDALRGVTGEEERRDVTDDEEEIFGVEAFDDEMLEGDFEDLEDDFEMEDVKPNVGDGAEGGGISLCGTSWDNVALNMAEEVSKSFDGDLSIFAFKTSRHQLIQVRIEKLSTKYGSPSMADIEAFTSAYRERLDEAVNAGTIPEDFSLEVSSPGLERAVRIPEDLERFQEKPMLVKYVVDDVEEASTRESEGIFRLISFDLESGYCTWGIADVRKNREKAGKGRPLSKKQREWRLQTPFKSLRLVRLYSEC